MNMKKKIKVFISQFLSPLIYILFVACAISFYLGEVIDAFIILIVVFINAIVGYIQQIRADEALEALKKLTSPHCLIKKNNEIIKIESSEVKVDDILILQEGDIIPSDGIVLTSNNLQVDESSLSGESLRVEKNKNDKIYESTIVMNGRAEALVTAIKEDTEFGKIASYVKKKSELTPLQKKLNHLSKILGIGTVLICLLMFIICLIRKEDIFETLITSISLAVAVIPEGLMSVVTIILSLGVQKMVKVNTIVRHLPSLETLGSVSLIASDKTGTITENKMTVKKIKAYHENFLLKAMILCNDSTLTQGDPTEIALLKYAGKKIDIEQVNKLYPRINEVPFSSETKMMETIHKFEGKTLSFIKGASEVILSKCNYVYINNQLVNFDDRLRKKIEKEISDFHLSAMRVLSFALIEDERYIYLGFVGEADPLRRGVKDAIKSLKGAGIKVVMITGDHKETAFAIGKELNLLNDISEVSLGNDVKKLSDEQLKNISVFARVLPLDKMEIVSRYKKLGYVVAMTGDGVNDAPSLKEADIGIAMGKNGTEVAKEVSSLILTDDNFNTIEKAIKHGRVIYDNIKKSILFLLSSNLAEVLVMFLCLLFKFPLPLIAIHILWVNLISDALPALALGTDPASSDVMNETPRKKTDSIFSEGGWKYTLGYGFIICLVTFVGFISVPLNELVSLNSLNINTLLNDIRELFKDEYILLKSQTIAFCVLGIGELFHMFSMSSNKESIIKILKKKNYFMIIVLLSSLLLQVLLTEVNILSNFFKVVSLSFREWLFIVFLSSFTLIFHEIIRKIK